MSMTIQPMQSSRGCHEKLSLLSDKQTAIEAQINKLRGTIFTFPCDDFGLFKTPFICPMRDIVVEYKKRKDEITHSPIHSFPRESLEKLLWEEFKPHLQTTILITQEITALCDQIDRIQNESNKLLQTHLHNLSEALKNGTITQINALIETPEDRGFAVLTALNLKGDQMALNILAANLDDKPKPIPEKIRFEAIEWAIVREKFDLLKKLILTSEDRDFVVRKAQATQHYNLAMSLLADEFLAWLS